MITEAAVRGDLGWRKLEDRRKGKKLKLLKMWDGRESMGHYSDHRRGPS